MWDMYKSMITHNIWCATYDSVMIQSRDQVLLKNGLMTKIQWKAGLKDQWTAWKKKLYLN